MSTKPSATSFRHARDARGPCDVGGHPREAGDDDVAVERLVRALAEHLGKPGRLDLAQHHVRVRHGQRAAAAVAGRARIRARALRTGTQPRTVEAEDRAAAGRHGVDAHHRRAHANPGDLRLERALEFTGEMRHVGRRAAHVEADHPAEVRELRRAHHADDAAGRPGQDRVLALERTRVGESARRLHEEQLHARHLGRHLVDVATQDRRQVGIDDGGVAAAHQLHQRARPVRRAHLRETDLARDRRGRGLVLREAIAVHEHDRDAAQSAVECIPQLGAQAFDIERRQHLAVGGQAFVGLDHLRIEQLGQLDVPIEQPWPILVGDAQRVAEAARGHQQRLLALAFQQRVRRPPITCPIDAARAAGSVPIEQPARPILVGDAQRVAEAARASRSSVFSVLRSSNAFVATVSCPCFTQATSSGVTLARPAFNPSRCRMPPTVDPELPARALG